MASWILNCSNCGLPFQHSVIAATAMNFFFPTNLISRRVVANFNVLIVEKPLRISALTLFIGLENTSLLRMLIGRRF